MADDKKIDFLLIGDDSNLSLRTQKICGEFGFSFFQVNNLDQFATNESLHSLVNFILLSAVSTTNQAEIAGMVQVVRQMVNDCCIVVVANKKISPDSAVFIKKSGGNLILLENEVQTTSKLEFVVLQKIRSSYTPIKVAELVKDSVPEFTAYHMMPLNKKFLPFVRRGEKLDEAKIKKAEPIGELYIKREDTPKYTDYIQKYQDRSAAGLKSRCRAQYLALNYAFADLVMLISDQSEFGSYAAGKALYEKCSQLANDLLTGLGAVGDAWDIVNNSAVGDFGSVERSPAIAAYSGLMCLLSSVGNQSDVLLAALMADIGMLELSPQITMKLKNHVELHAEERAEYEKHPIFSLTQCLSRKLPLSENIKNIILATHERADMKGFPNQIRPDKIPDEAQVIQLCEMIDRACMIEMGKARVEVVTAKKAIFESETAEKQRFTFAFLEKVKSALI